MPQRVFKSVGVETKVSQISKQLLSAIEEGVFKPGERLPSERGIAKQMEVSRNAVREALTSLQVLGVVESKTGDGTYVTEQTKSSEFAKKAADIIEHSNEPSEIIKGREVFELGFIDMVVEKCTSADLARLEKSLEGMREQAKTGDYQKYLQAGRHFHVSFAKCCHNSVIEEIAKTLWKITNSQLSSRIHQSYCADHIEESLEIHLEILQSVEDRDSSTVKGSIRKHYSELKDFLMV